MGFFICLLLLLALIRHSSGVYCVCKDGLSDLSLQKSIDYACGTGADCSAILQSGGCYQPNTVKGHCDYAVNSYFQRKGQANGTCDFAGTAVQTATLPTTVISTCVYQSTPSNTGTTTGTGTGTGTTTGTGTGTTTGSGTGTGSTGTGTDTSSPTSIFSIGPTGVDSGVASLFQGNNLPLTFVFITTGLVLMKLH